jgi:hypothetical protein
MPAVRGRCAGSDGSSLTTSAGPAPIGWRIDLLLGGLGAMLVGGTVVLCLYAWLLADEDLLLPAEERLPAEVAAAGEEDNACDVTAVECANDVTLSGFRVSLTLSAGVAGAATQLVLPLPPTAVVACTDPASAAAALRHVYSLEVGSTSRCVLRSGGPGGPAVQIEVARPVGTAAFVKFVLACAVTCTPCCVAVGLALALAAHPEAHALAVMVEEKTRQSGLLPRCDFDARALGSASSGPSPLGKLV